MKVTKQRLALLSTTILGLYGLTWIVASKTLDAQIGDALVAYMIRSMPVTPYAEARAHAVCDASTDGLEVKEIGRAHV